MLKRRVAPEALEFLKYADENVLRQILEVVCAVCEPRRDAEDARLVSVHERGEGIAIAALGRPHECVFIGVISRRRHDSRQ